MGSSKIQRDMKNEAVPPHPSDYAPGVYPRGTLRDAYFIILKHRWQALAVILAVWLFAAVGKYRETPVYRATALIQIDWGHINVVQDVMVNQSRASADLYGTQEELVTSRLLAERVVEDLELWQHPVFAPSAAGADLDVDREEVVKRIARSVQEMVDVTRIKKTQLMEVSFISPDPELTARLANAQVEQYIQFNVDSESGLARNTSTFIDEEISELRREITEKEQQLRAHSKQNSIVMAETHDTNIVVQRLQTLNQQLVEAEMQRAASEARYINLRRADPSSLDDVRNSDAVRELERKYMNLSEKNEALASTFGPDWPERKRAQSAMEEAKRAIEIKSRQEADNVVGGARVAYREALDREKLLRESLNAQKTEAQDLEHASSDFAQVKAEIDNQRQILQSLLRRRSETDITADLGERQPVRVKFIERAETPTAAFSPGGNRRFLFMLALGVVLGVGVAYVLDHWDDSIHTIEDLQRDIPLPYLGMIPRYGEDTMMSQIGRHLQPQAHAARQRRLVPPEAKQSSYLPTIYDHRSALAEQRDTLRERFRFLRGSMLLSTPESVPRIVLVTSPDKNCGKTFVSSNLSHALGQLNKRVLLIDGDLRNPKLHRVFRYRNRIGLSNVLTGQSSLQDGCIMRTEIPNLFLMMSGPKSPNPGELLASPAMERTLKNCAEHFDFVILDSAPLLPVFDSHVLSTRCDGVILVARAGVTTRHAAMQSVDLIERVNGKITGIVLNDVNLEDYAQHYYHSRYSYEYGSYPEEDDRVGLG
jgi:capsular exopolysaccharide synthesis family protein